MYLTELTVYFTFFVELQTFLAYAEINSVALEYNQPIQNRTKFVATNATVRFFLDQAVYYSAKLIRKIQ